MTRAQSIVLKDEPLTTTLNEFFPRIVPGINGHTTPSTITDDMDDEENSVTLMEVTYLPCILNVTQFVSKSM